MAPQTVRLYNAAREPLRNEVRCPRMEVKKLGKSLFQKSGTSDPATIRENSGSWRLYTGRSVFPDSFSDYGRVNTVYAARPTCCSAVVHTAALFKCKSKPSVSNSKEPDIKFVLTE